MTIKDWDDPRGVGFRRQIDLEPLRDPMENGGLKLLIEILRDVHHNYSCLMVENEANHGTSYAGENIPNQLYYLKILAEAFEKIREKAIKA
jgi:hypothetical protein